MLRPLFAIAVFAALTCRCISPAHALEVIGHIIAIEGEAFVERRGEPVFRLAEEDQIFEGDLVETAPDSSAHMVMADGTELTLDGDSAMQLGIYSYDENAGDNNRSLMTLVRGSALYLSGRISKGGGSAGIKTNYGSLGIRGTEFWVGERMTDMGEGLGVFVENGEVELRNWAGSVRVKKGLGSHVFGFGKRPSPPRAWGKGGIAKTFGKLKQRRAELRQRRKDRIRNNIEKMRDKHRQRLEMRQERRDDMQQKFQQRQENKQQQQQQQQQQHKKNKGPNKNTGKNTGGGYKLRD